MRKVTLKLKGIEQKITGETNESDVVTIEEMDYQLEKLPIDLPEVATVYGTLLNFKGAYAVLEPEMHEAPYKKPPQAPILYIKPKNTFINNGQAIPMPDETDALEIGATLGIVIGKTATKITKANAMDFVEGFTLVNDVSIPHESVHRPAVKEKARDGFCPIGPWVVAKEDVPNPNELTITVAINGESKLENSTKITIRSIEELLVDVTQFMTLHQGDVLLLGVPENAPLAKANDLVQIEIEHIGKLENRVIKEKDIIGGGWR